MWFGGVKTKIKDNFAFFFLHIKRIRVKTKKHNAILKMEYSLYMGVEPSICLKVTNL